MPDTFDFPYEVTVTTYVQTADEDGILRDPSAGTSATKMVSIDTAPSRLTLTDYGIEAGYGAVMFVPWVDRNAFPLMAEIDFEGQKFTVKSAPALKPDPVLGHAEIVIERQPV